MYITLHNLYIPEVHEKRGGIAFYTDDPAQPYKFQHSAPTYAAIVEWAKKQDYKIIIFANGNTIAK